MKTKRRVTAVVVIVLTVGLGSAWAQIAVTDGLTTARNRVVAMLKMQIVDVVEAQYERLRDMARRMSAEDLGRYAIGNAPDAGANTLSPLVYGESFLAAVAEGQDAEAAFVETTRARQSVEDALAGLPPQAREAIERELATLDASDSSLIVALQQMGQLRTNGGHERRAIDALEADVLDPSSAQSATAVLDKISGAGLLEARQKQARLQYLMSLVEQLAIDNKRARDTETALLNMQVRRLLSGRSDEEGGAGMLDGAANDLRTWRQP
jgi:hypothetical protein